MPNLKQLYADRQAESTIALGAIRKSLRYISLARLVVALLFIIIGYFAFSYSILIYLMPLLAGLFFFLVTRFAKCISHQSSLRKFGNVEHTGGQSVGF